MAISQKKKILSIIIAVCMFVIACGYCGGQTAYAVTNNRGIALVDAETGMLIYGENPDAVKEMASTTKIFTAYFVLEKCKADEIDMKVPIRIEKEWTGIEGSSIYLTEGEMVSIEELLYGLMLRSGNDSAVALAEIVFGSVENYVAYANNRLCEMGYKNTALQNPHGLPAENHHTTARELALFSATAMKDCDFAKIVSSKTYSGARTLYANKNKILQNVEGGNGIKTGYTKSAGRCLVSGAERDGHQIVLATLNTYDMFERSKAHIDSFFQNYEYVDISKTLKENAVPVEILGVTAEITTKDNILAVPIPKGEKAEIKVKTIKSLPFYAKSGTICGELEVYVKNCLIFSQKLYTKETINVI
ncbi:MAG: D-alanyl-D-alanine carboxypeptidase family protein [Bacillota bacterium]